MIIDGNHMLHRAYHKFKRMTSRNGESTSCLYGFPMMLQSVTKKLQPDIIYTVFDGSSNPIRRAILPEYRKRESRLDFDGEDFGRQKDEIKRLCNALGCKVVYSPKTEGDDWAYPIIRKHRKSIITIVSGDKDFNQLLSKNVRIWNPNKEVLFTEKNFENREGIAPNQVVDFLSLWGDSSDKIPGYPGIGEKRGKDFLKKFGSIKKFLKSDDTYGKVDKELLAEIYTINNKLINLKYFYRNHQKGVKIPILKGSGFDLNFLTEYSERYNIKLTNEPDFIDLFENGSKKDFY